jgi:hypothetical protein
MPQFHATSAIPPMSLQSPGIGALGPESIDITSSGQEAEVGRETEKGAQETEEESSYPKELLFLASPMCNPDFSNHANRVQGCLRRTFSSSSSLNTHNTQAKNRKPVQKATAQHVSDAIEAAQKQTTEFNDIKGHSHCAQFRRSSGRLIFSTRTQTLLCLIILGDCIVTIWKLTHNRKSYKAWDAWFATLDWIVVVSFSFDIIARFIYLGKSFFLLLAQHLRGSSRAVHGF